MKQKNKDQQGQQNGGEENEAETEKNRPGIEPSTRQQMTKDKVLEMVEDGKWNAERGKKEYEKPEEEDTEKPDSPRLQTHRATQAQYQRP